MAVQHGYGKIAGTDALVFAYDTGDTRNSYKGEPTVNIAADLGLTDLGAGLTYLGVEDGWKKYSMSGTWSGGSYPYSMALNAVTFTGGQPYSVVATLKTNVENKFNYFCTSGISYVNAPKDYEGTLSATLNPDGSRTVRRVNFAYTSTTGQLGYLFTNPVSGITFNSATDFVWVKEYQAEQKTHPTQFVNGTRSATQGLLDVAGGKTIDLTSVSFDANADIEFDGTNDVILAPSGFPSSVSEYTIEYVARLDSAARMPIASYSNTAFYKYGDYSWYYTHGGSAAEFYYPNGGGYITGWGHWVITYDGSNVKVYRNNSYLGAQASSGTADFSQGWRIGYWSSGGGYAWDGKIPVVKIYTRALTQAEVANNYKFYKNRFTLP